jgi:hypothetical protein
MVPGDPFEKRLHAWVYFDQPEQGNQRRKFVALSSTQPSQARLVRARDPDRSCSRDLHTPGQPALLDPLLRPSDFVNLLFQRRKLLQRP